MSSGDSINKTGLARLVGLALLSTVIVGAISAFFVAEGIDINLSADAVATAGNMLEAEQSLRAKAYLAIIVFLLEAFIVAGFFVLLRPVGEIVAAVSAITGVTSAILIIIGAVFALNAAEIAGNPAYANILADEKQRMLLSGLQATSDYTSFHLGLVLGMIAKTGVYYLLFRSSMIPKIIAGWGIFASLFVATTIVARDFIPVLGHTGITVSFMAANMITLFSTSVYLLIYGVRKI